jgi:transcriptional regulator with XRE-family HTH domain
MVQQRNTEQSRAERMAALRQQGQTYAEIGRRLGVSRQTVEVALRRATERVARSVPCCRCGSRIVSPVLLSRHAGKVLCRACLARVPGVAFGQRLLSLRLAAGVTGAALARRAGLHPQVMFTYDRLGCRPRPSSLAKLVRVLGPNLNLPDDCPS